jgi:acyl-CoA synthetase
MTYRAPDDEIAAYHQAGWWTTTTLSDRIAELAATKPEAPAFIVLPHGAAEPYTTTWREYDALVTSVASALIASGLQPGDRVAVLMPDRIEVHAALVGVSRAGLVAVGLGHRAGEKEVVHLLGLTGARALCTTEIAGGKPATQFVDAIRAAGVTIDHHIVVSRDGVAGAPGGPIEREQIGPDELFLLNSTSGTTGLPKCVMHTQNRWHYFHQLAADAGELKEDDVFFGAVPAPFGFGLWTSHFTPTLLGAPTVVMERFNADAALDLIEARRVTVLCCVSTQFILMLNAQAERPRSLSSLRSMFTGGENVPYERAAEFEETTGAKVLQFYGSNETGALSYTSTADTREHRLRSAGKVIPDMHVRMFDPETQEEFDEPGRPGVPACKGPATCIGYWGDESANQKLRTPDGWMLMGDIVTIDAEGYLRVVGRVSDFIIRGGKNISAPAVEDEVGTHPDVAQVAAVAMPDPVFGERVAIYVVPKAGTTITLESVVAHLTARGVSREWYPEHLILMDDLPRSSGGKVAKGDLKQDAARRAADAQAAKG